MSDFTAHIVISETGAKEAAAGIKQVGAASGEAQGKVAGLTEAGDGLKSAFAALGVSFAVSEVVKMADAVTNLSNRLSTVTRGMADSAGVMSRLSDIGEKYSQSVDGIGQMYVSLAGATKNLNVDQGQLLNVTEAVSAIMHSSGRSADEVNSSMGRLAAGIQEGAVSGRNLTMMFVQFPELATAIAKSLGVSTQMLFKMGEAGTINSKVLLDALQKSRQAAIDQASTMEDTFADAWQRAKNGISDAVGVIDKASGHMLTAGTAAETLSGFMKILAVDVFALSGRAGSLTESLGKLANQFTNNNSSLNQWLSRITGINPAVNAADTRVQAFGHQVDSLSSQVQRGDITLRQAQVEYRQLAQAYASGSPALDGLISRQQKLHTSQMQVTDAVNAGALTQRQGVTAVKALTDAFNAGGAQLDSVSQKYETFITESQKLVDAVNSGSMTLAEATKKFAELQAGIQGANRGLEEHITTVSRTKSTIDSFGNTIRTTTESVQGANGKMTDLKETIDRMDSGVHTVTVSVRTADGAWHQLSSTIEQATQFVAGNTSTLNQNTAALNANAVAAANAAAKGAGGGGGGGGGSDPNAVEREKQRQAAIDAFQDSSLHPSDAPPSGMFQTPGGYQASVGARRIDFLPTDATQLAFTEFNTKVKELKQQVALATGISEAQWPRNSAFNPYLAIPPMEQPSFTQSTPFGTIPTLQELLDRMALANQYSTGQHSTAATGSGGSPFSITTPVNTPANGTLTFATGGAFDVGGQGGQDSQYVSFWASPDERVSISTPSQRDAANKSGTTIAPQVFMTVNARDAGSFGRNKTQIMQVLNQGIQRAVSQLQQRRR